jgi:hypothetical protein
MIGYALLRDRRAFSIYILVSSFSAQDGVAAPQASNPNKRSNRHI